MEPPLVIQGGLFLAVPLIISAASSTVFQCSSFVARLCLTLSQELSGKLALVHQILAQIKASGNGDAWTSLKWSEELNLFRFTAKKQKTKHQTSLSQGHKPDYQRNGDQEGR